MSKQIRTQYFMFLIIVVIVAIVIETPNFISENFGLGLVGVLFIITSIFGLRTKSIFLGSPIIVPSSSDSILVKIANIFIGLVGVYLIIFNLHKNLT